MSKKLVIFDFDGVLVNTFALSYWYYQEYAPGEVGEDEYRSWYDGNIFDSLDKRAAIRKKLPAHEEYYRVFADRVVGIPIIPGIAEVIRALADDYAVSMVSSNARVAIDAYLQLHELEQYFDEILDRDFHKSKVHKIEKLLADHGVRSAEAVLVTDTLGDIREAAKADVKSIGVTWGYHRPETLLRSDAVAVLTDANQIVPAVNRYFSGQNT